MKKVLLGVTLILALALAGCKTEEQPVEPAPKVAVLNIGLVFQTSKVSTAAAEYIAGVESELQAQLDAATKELPKDENGGMSDEDMMKLQPLLAEVQNRYNAEQQMVLSRLNALAMEVVDEYREANNLDVIIRLDQVFSFNPAIDITDKVIEIMDSREISFEPMLPEVTPDTAQESEALAPAEDDAPAANATAPAANATAPAGE